MRKPELLAPAGDMERLRMAVLYGADAVYLAGTSFGMRSFAGNFSPEELPEAVAFAHAHGVRVHVTVNTMPRGDELPALPAHLRLLNDSGVDALILADLGVFRMAQREAPNCELHISTQVSIANAACAAAWHELGAFSRGDPRHPPRYAAGAGAGDVCARGHVRVVLRPLPAVQLYDGPRQQPRRMRAALPLSVCPHGGKAPRRVFPRV